MSKLSINDNAPSFQLPDQNAIVHHLPCNDKWTVLYFYPKDITPGCIIENKGFSALINDFTKHNVAVFGISKDDEERHKKFIKTCNLSTTLLSDKDAEVCNKYGVWQELKLFGIKHHGICRSTFLIDSNGIIREIWMPVKISGHAKAVLDKIISLE